jgi:hypothetical protein
MNYFDMKNLFELSGMNLFLEAWMDIKKKVRNQMLFI